MPSRFFYLTLEQVQRELDALRLQTGRPATARQAVLSCYARGEGTDTHRNRELFKTLYHCSNEEFLKTHRQLSAEYDYEALSRQARGPEREGLGERQMPRHQKRVDVFVESLFYQALDEPHRHDDVFEVFFIYHGSCTFTFEGREMTLHTGDFGIVAPHSRHSLCVNGPDDLVIRQYIYSEPFRTSFVRVLEDDTVLSHFFKMILTNTGQGNYLLFSIPDTSGVMRIARNLYLEQFKYDDYAPACTFYWIQLLFANILRKGIHTYQISTDYSDVRFTPIVEYMQKHYKTATLSDMAADLHYSVPYLSAYIRRLTGSSYTAITRELKMKEACEYLLYTSKSIDEISALVGYHSPDHFSRVFRSCYGVSPSEYRRAGREETQ